MTAPKPPGPGFPLEPPSKNRTVVLSVAATSGTTVSGRGLSSSPRALSSLCRVGWASQAPAKVALYALLIARFAPARSRCLIEFGVHELAAEQRADLQLWIHCTPSKTWICQISYVTSAANSLSSSVPESWSAGAVQNSEQRPGSLSPKAARSIECGSLPSIQWPICRHRWMTSAHTTCAAGHSQ